MSISARRKGVFESRPTGSKIRQTQRRPVGAVVGRVHSLRVNAAELARRKFLHLAAGAAALPVISRSARAQAYPTRPITMVVPVAAGGPVDVVGRVLAEKMIGSLGKPIIIENVSGGNGTIGTLRTARAKPDGYTIELGSASTHMLNGAIYSLPYDVLNDFAAVSPLVAGPYVLFGRKALPANDLHELIAWLRANPNKAPTGFYSAGSNLVAAIFQKETGVQLTFVPYRGAAPAMQDLVAGQIALLFAAPDFLSQVPGGSIKAYAVTSDTRSALAPDIPTFSEIGLLSWSVWYGLFAPKGTPKDIVGKLNAAAVDALADPAARSRLINLGMDIYPRERQTSEALSALQKADAEKWWPLIKEFGIKAE